MWKHFCFKSLQKALLVYRLGLPTSHLSIALVNAGKTAQSDKGAWVCVFSLAWTTSSNTFCKFGFVVFHQAEMTSFRLLVLWLQKNSSCYENTNQPSLVSAAVTLLAGNHNSKATVTYPIMPKYGDLNASFTCHAVAVETEKKLQFYSDRMILTSVSDTFRGCVVAVQWETRMTFSRNWTTARWLLVALTGWSVNVSGRWLSISSHSSRPVAWWYK